MDRRRISIMSSMLLIFTLLGAASSEAWDPQPTNPFPGVAYNAAIPGLTKTITCTDTPQIPDDCVRQGGGQVTCPAWTANDITWVYRSDGSVASLISWCRNSWLPPTSDHADSDFRAAQEAAIAAATLAGAPPAFFKKC